MGIISVAKRNMKTRKAKGFSKKELKEAQISLDEALRHGIPVDTRRSSKHEDNVQTLRTFIEETKSIVPKKEETKVAKSKIENIEGIGPTYAQKLIEIGIKTTEDLLQAGSAPKGREDIAAKTGISKKLILEWVNLADLFRIKGIGEEYSDLLEEAGVDTVVELSRRVPENLHAKVTSVNETKKLVRRPPSLEEIREWIEQAKELPRKIEY
jgi:predicted flap endonuclease-1-like 5' DNA nuclease